jgi:hypothetical protein
VNEALALWEEGERTRAEIFAAVDEAEASLPGGEGRIITQSSMRDRAKEVKQRGRDRLAAEQTSAGQWLTVFRLRLRPSWTSACGLWPYNASPRPR